MSNTPLPAGPGARLAQEHSHARILATVTLFTALTALGAQVTLRLPFTPVPVTLQVLFALLAGAALGSRLGALSQLQYLALGAAGLPLFAGGVAGVTAFAGPSAGYLPGLVAGAWLVGRLTERAPRPTPLRLFLAMVGGVAAIYAPGVLWLSLWLRVVQGAPWVHAMQQAALLGAAPFVVVDLAKAMVAAGLSTRLGRPSL
ncbi:MAG: biotin transporter BioY [Armatimonadetes bacterium]|nr:biotin transporter BioY [Armatimonadota bacterium]